MGLLNKQATKVVGKAVQGAPKHIPGQVKAKTGPGAWDIATNAFNVLGTGAILAGFVIPTADVKKREELLKRQEALAAEGKLYMPYDVPQTPDLQPGSMRDIQPPEYKELGQA